MAVDHRIPVIDLFAGRGTEDVTVFCTCSFKHHNLAFVQDSCIYCHRNSRKICFGTRSDSGLKTHSIIPTLVQTARRQGVHPREFLHTLHTADTATAQAALYNNSS
jgi:hypothetical protein